MQHADHVTSEQAPLPARRRFEALTHVFVRPSASVFPVPWDAARARADQCSRSGDPGSWSIRFADRENLLIERRYDLWPKWSRAPWLAIALIRVDELAVALACARFKINDETAPGGPVRAYTPLARYPIAWILLPRLRGAAGNVLGLGDLRARSLRNIPLPWSVASSLFSQDVVLDERSWEACVSELRGILAGRRLL